MPSCSTKTYRFVNRTACALIGLLFGAFLDTGSAIAQELIQPTATSRFPVVVVERDASFSIPDAAAQPALSLPPVAAQPFLPKEKYQRTANPIIGATELISEGFERSVVEVVNKQQQRLSLGTVVSLKGHVLTKYSLVKDTAPNQMRFRYKNLLWLATKVGVDETNDLILFALHSGQIRPAKILRPVSFTTDGRLGVGKFVIGVGNDSQTLSVGITTVAPTPQAIESDCENCIDMGLTLATNLTLSRVYPRTVGERLGLLVGDRILSINGQPLTSQLQFAEMEKEIRGGDLIAIRVQRQQVTFEIIERIPELTKVTKRDRWGGGPFSKRRSGFSEVLVHDSVISPEDCGGPLVNLQGQFCGINIARSMRVASFAIPAEPVKQFLRQHLLSSEMTIE